MFIFMAAPRGLEPPTHSLENCSSILLSYGDAEKLLSRQKTR